MLSVVGFYALLVRFLSGKWFILRREEPSFLGEDPILFDNPGITVTSGYGTGVYSAGIVYGRVCTGCMYSRVYLPREGRRHIYQDIPSLPSYQETHYAPHSFFSHGS